MHSSSPYNFQLSTELLSELIRGFCLRLAIYQQLDDRVHTSKILQNKSSYSSTEYTTIPYAVICMNTDMLHAYKEEKKKSFSQLFCICCITTQARNNGLLKWRTDQISKGLKPGLSDKEPGNTFSTLPILSPVINIVVKRRNTKSTGKSTCIFSRQAELTRECLCFLLPLLNSLLEESLDKRQDKNRSFTAT